MKTKILGLLAVTLLAGPMAAHAVTVSAGESVLWSFDLTGQTVPPPYSYDRLFGNFSQSTYDSSDSGFWTLYTDAAGTVLHTSQPDPLLSSSLANFNFILDGIGSVRLTMIAGSVDVAPCATGLYAGFDGASSQCVAGTVVGTVPGTVPEPGSLALLGLGLLGLGVSRRKA